MEQISAAESSGHLYEKVCDSVGKIQLRTRWHSTKLTWKCNKCPRAFNYRPSLMIHKRVHTRVKPFKCLVCHELFSQHSNLQLHMRTHSVPEGVNAQIIGDKAIEEAEKASGAKEFPSSVQTDSEIKAEVVEEAQKESGPTTVSGFKIKKEDLEEAEKENDALDFITSSVQTVPKSEIITEALEETEKENDAVDFTSSSVVQTVPESEITTEATEEAEEENDALDFTSSSLQTVPESEITTETRFSSDDEPQAKKHKAEHTYRCLKCSRKFSDKQLLASHERVHFEYPFRCDRCGKFFFYYQKLWEHKLTHRSGEFFDCADCGGKFINRVDLESHECQNRRITSRDTVESVTHPMEEEQMSYDDSSTEEANGTEESSSQPTISDCEMEVESSTEEAYVTEESSSQSTISDYEMEVETSFSNDDKKLFKCAECVRTFSKKCHLANHLRAHNNDSAYKCECGNPSSTMNGIRAHIKKMHKGSNVVRYTQGGHKFTLRGSLVYYESENRQTVSRDTMPTNPPTFETPVATDEEANSAKEPPIIPDHEMKVEAVEQDEELKITKESASLSQISDHNKMKVEKMTDVNDEPNEFPFEEMESSATPPQAEVSATVASNPTTISTATNINSRVAATPITNKSRPIMRNFRVAIPRMKWPIPFKMEKEIEVDGQSGAVTPPVGDDRVPAQSPIPAHSPLEVKTEVEAGGPSGTICLPVWSGHALTQEQLQQLLENLPPLPPLVDIPAKQCDEKVAHPPDTEVQADGISGAVPPPVGGDHDPAQEPMPEVLSPLLPLVEVQPEQQCDEKLMPASQERQQDKTRSHAIAPRSRTPSSPHLKMLSNTSCTPSKSNNIFSSSFANKLRPHAAHHSWRMPEDAVRLTYFVKPGSPKVYIDPYERDFKDLWKRALPMIRVPVRGEMVRMLVDMTLDSSIAPHDAFPNHWKTDKCERLEIRWMMDYPEHSEGSFDVPLSMRRHEGGCVDRNIRFSYHSCLQLYHPVIGRDFLDHFNIAYSPKCRTLLLVDEETKTMYEFEVTAWVWVKEMVRRTYTGFVRVGSLAFIHRLYSLDKRKDNRPVPCIREPSAEQTPDFIQCQELNLFPNCTVKARSAWWLVAPRYRNLYRSEVVLKFNRHMSM